MAAREMKSLWLLFLLAATAIGVWSAGMITLVQLVASPVDFNSEQPEPAFSDVSAFSQNDISLIDDWLKKKRELAKYPSLSVAIVRDGEMVYSNALGFANLKSQERASPETSYHVASVTKVFTTSVAVLLHDRGLVDLDKPVVDYLPEGVAISTDPKRGATITLRQLASHTSGLPRSVPGNVQRVDGRYELVPDLLYEHLSDVTMVYDPGTDELYSNLGMGLLGHALEFASGKPFSQLVKELVCEPLKLRRTSIDVGDGIHLATGYGRSQRRREEDFSRLKRLSPSGGLIASAEDLAVFLTAQMEPGVFSSEMLDQLRTQANLSTGLKATTGLGWSVRRRASVGRILKKNGGRNSCSAWIGFAPDHKVGVVVVTNCGDPDVDDIGYWLLERSVPGGCQPVGKYGYAKVAPFTGVRWANNRPVVRVQNTWSPLVSVNGILTKQIMEFADENYGKIARKRFAEDLVEVMDQMGHPLDWMVTLELKAEDGQTRIVETRLTEQKRSLVRQ